MKKEPKAMQAFFAAVLLTIIVSLILFILFNTAAVDSDYVEGVFWANATIESKSIISDTFYYPYAIPFGSNLLFAPFVKLYGISLLSNRLGMTCFFAFFLLTVFYYAYSAEKKYGKISVMLCCIGILIAFRTRISENILNHILFYMLGYINMLGILAAINIIDCTGRKRHYIVLAFYVLWGASNGIPSIALSIFPVMVGLVITEFEKKGENRRKILNIVVFISALTIIGLLGNKAILLNVHESTYLKNVGSYNFLPVKKWFEMLSTLPQTWFSLFFLHDTEGVRVLSLQGIETILEILLSLVITAAPILLLIDYKKKKLNPAEEKVLFSSLTVWTVCLAQYILFRGKEARLLYNCMLVNSLLFAVWIARRVPEFIYKKHQKCTILCTSLAVVLMFVFFAAKETGELDLNLVHDLESRGLTYGFASYWNANINTVLSNNAIKLRNVSVSNGIIMHDMYNTDMQWYKPQDSDFFVLLTKEEYNTLSMNKYYNNKAKEIVAIGDYYIMIFDQGIWENIINCPVYDYSFQDSTWSRNCDTTKSVRYIHDGGVTFGPYLQVSKGSTYMVTIQGKALSYATVAAYSSQCNNYEIEYSEATDEEITFSVAIREDAERFEIAIKNSEQDSFSDDILITSIVITEDKLSEKL